MYQTLGFKDATYPNHVWHLRKSLYGLKQAPWAWYKRFADHASLIGFFWNKCGHSLFIYKKDSNLSYLLLYIDDVIHTTSFETLRQSIISLHNSEFAIKDLRAFLQPCSPIHAWPQDPSHSDVIQFCLKKTRLLVILIDWHDQKS
jgi:hypothetical protein